MRSKKAFKRRQNYFSTTEKQQQKLPTQTKIDKNYKLITQNLTEESHNKNNNTSKKKDAVSPINSGKKIVKKIWRDVLQSTKFQYWLIKKQFLKMSVITVVFAILIISVFIVSLLPTLVSQLKNQFLEGYKPFVGHVSYSRAHTVSGNITNSNSDNYIGYDSSTSKPFLDYKSYSMLNNLHLFATSGDSPSASLSPSNIDKNPNYAVGQTFTTFNYNLALSSVIKTLTNAQANKLKKNPDTSWLVAKGHQTTNGKPYKGKPYKYNEKNANSLNLYELFNTNTFSKNIKDKNNNLYNAFVAFKQNESSETINNLFAIIMGIYTSLGLNLMSGGLGGLVLNNYTICELIYLDGVSYLLGTIYLARSFLDKNILLYAASAGAAKAITNILFKGPLNTPAGHLVFDKYRDSKKFTPDIDVEIASFLADLVSFFSPSFIGKPILESENKIKKQFKKIHEYLQNDKKNSDKLEIIDSNYWISNLLENDKFIKGKSYSFNFGALPFDPTQDELYTHIFNTVTHNGNNISFEGYNDNSLFWGIHPVQQEELFNQGAFATYIDAHNTSKGSQYKIHTGETKYDAIPVIVNKSALFDHPKWTIGGQPFELTSKKLGLYRQKSDTPGKFQMLNVPLWCKVVGVSNNYGKDEIYTSREEANYYVFQRVSMIGSSWKRDSITDNNPVYVYGVPGQKDPRGDNLNNISSEMTWFEKRNINYSFPEAAKKNYSVPPKIAPSLVNNTHGAKNPQNSTINSAMYGDGYGYFNSVNFTKEKSNNAINTVMVDFNSDAGGSQGFKIKDVNHIQYVSTNIFSKSLLQATVSSIIRFLLVIFLIGSCLIFFTILIIFIMSQKIIIEQNRSSFTMLKLLGYSTRNILLSTTIFYIICGVVLCIASLLFYKLFVNFFFALISNIIPSAIEIKFNNLSFSWISCGIFLACVGVFYGFFLLSSWNTIRKIRCVREE